MASPLLLTNARKGDIMPTKDRNGNLHSNSNGQFVEKGANDVGGPDFDSSVKNGTKQGHNATLREGVKHRSNSSSELSTTSPEDFVHKLLNAKNKIEPERRWRVDLHDMGDYEKDNLFVSEGGSCVAVEPSGNIISVCKIPGDNVRGSDLLEFAVKNGGDRLDAFGESLFSFYTKNGFEPVSWTPFNKEYAPFEWRDAQAQGLKVEEEPVIFYKYTGIPYDKSYEEFLSEIPSCEGENGYDDAMNIRDKEIDDAKKK